MYALAKLQDRFDSYEIAVSSWMERHGYRLLRIAMGIVFIWFAVLKPLGLSPAEALVAKATAWIPIPGFLYILTAWEIAIGVCFLFKRLNRWAVVLLLMHMPGTLLPLVTLPDETFVRFPFVLTLEGQYIIKNLVLIAAGIVLGGKIPHRLRSATRTAPDAFHSLLRQGQLGVAREGELLAREGELMNKVFFIRSGGGVVRVGEREVGRIGPDQFIGEMSFFTRQTAAATVEVTEATRYVAWDREELRSLVSARQAFEHALLKTITLDLVSKIQNGNEPASARVLQVAASD
jgi:CRP-like cAMP-binding protein